MFHPTDLQIELAAKKLRQIADAADNSNQAGEDAAMMAAAASDLYMALKRLVERIDHNGGIGEYTGGPSFVMRDARAALAKAEGHLTAPRPSEPSWDSRCCNHDDILSTDRGGRL